MEGICIVCNNLTKYTCLKCESFVCNRGIWCSVPASEEYPGWKCGSSVALCNNCDKKEAYATADIIAEVEKEETSDSETNAFSGKESAEETLFWLACASSSFHEYRKIWAPRINQQLVVKPERGNIFNPFAMSVYTKIRGKIELLSLVGHLPREISRLCKYFIEYGGNLRANVRNTKFRRSPLPQGGLEIPISLAVIQNKASLEIY